jgi:hypothetical protein
LQRGDERRSRVVTADRPILSGRHQDTLRHIFAHPLSHNLEWRAVLALLREVATVKEMHDGHIDITGGGEQFVITRPHQKDLDAEDVVIVRRFLESLGYTSDGG